MLHILIAAAGTWRTAPERPLWEAYLGRLPWKVELLEIAAKDREAEGEKMQEAASRFHAHQRVALDERGKNLTSREFAAQLAQWQDTGDNRIAFFIGGHHGLSEGIKKQANLLSFGKMTWPHLLTRVLLAEQLYRAQTIIAGHPYHRD